MYNFIVKTKSTGGIMKFNIKRELLANTLSDFTLILKENPIKPILAGLKIEVKEGKITFIGTNLESSLIKTVEGKITEEGTVIVKPQLILEYVKLLEIETIEIASDESSLKVHQAEFIILNEEGYPKVKELLPIEITKTNKDLLINGLEKCRFSAHPLPENLALNCIRILFKNKYTEFVSTDSYRLTYLKEKIPCIMEKEFSVPLESVNAASKLLKEVNSDVTIGFSDNMLILLWEGSYFSTRTVDLPFPDFKGILSYNGFDKTMEFNTNEFKSALKKVMTVAKTSYETKYGAVFEFKNKTLVIKTYSGKGKITQKVNMLKEGEDFRGSLNTKFMLEFLNNITENVIVRGTNASSMFEISEYGNENYKYILMPLALRN